MQAVRLVQLWVTQCGELIHRGRRASSFKTFSSVLIERLKGWETVRSISNSSLRRAGEEGVVQCIAAYLLDAMMTRAQ